MKVWEAIEMLQGMDGNKEVTVTMGKPKAVTPPEFHLNPIYVHPKWAPNSNPWYPPNTITCKMQ